MIHFSDPPVAEVGVRGLGEFVQDVHKAHLPQLVLTLLRTWEHIWQQMRKLIHPTFLSICQHLKSHLNVLNDGNSKGLVVCRVQFAPNTSHHHPEQKSHHLFENYEYTWETPSQPLSLKYSHITVDKLFCERLHRHCAYGVFVLGLCGFQLCVESSRGPKAHICWTLTLAVLTCADLCWPVGAAKHCWPLL